MQAQAALVGAYGTAELNAVATVDLDLAGVVNPGNAEDDDALGLDEALEKACGLVLGMRIQSWLQGGEDLLGCLDELWLGGIALLELSYDLLGI